LACSCCCPLHVRCTQLRFLRSLRASVVGVVGFAPSGQINAGK
jgi:hypothetical protein